MYKIHVTTESQGKPENPYKHATYGFREQHPTLLCLLPNGEKAPKGEYETDGEVTYHVEIGNHFYSISEANKNAWAKDHPVISCYIVTTPANEQQNIDDGYSYYYEVDGDKVYCKKDIYDKLNSLMPGSAFKRTDLDVAVDVFLGTFPANEQPKEEMCIVCDEEISNKSFCADCGLNRAEDRPAPSLAPVDESVEEIKPEYLKLFKELKANKNCYFDFNREFILHEAHVIKLMKQYAEIKVNECLKGMVKIDDVVKVIERYRAMDGSLKITADGFIKLINSINN